MLYASAVLFLKVNLMMYIFQKSILVYIFIDWIDECPWMHKGIEEKWIFLFCFIFVFHFAKHWCKALSSFHLLLLLVTLFSNIVYSVYYGAYNNIIEHTLSHSKEWFSKYESSSKTCRSDACFPINKKEVLSSLIIIFT